MTKRLQAERSRSDRAVAPSRSWNEWLGSNWDAILIFAAACAVCLGYTLVTNQVWEDSLITLRHGENLLRGDGLTFNPGERVHGFTSPINVLLLTVSSWLAGSSTYATTFWIYRLFSIPAFAASAVLLIKAVKEVPPRWQPALWFAGVIYVFEIKSVAYSINGMETAFMLLFVAWAVYLVSRANDAQWLLRGLCWGGMMWSRPDGFVYIGALSLCEWMFLSTSRRVTFVSLLKSAVVCAAIYCPWFIWAWAYYGSPVPHTIIAKTNVEQPPLGQLWAALDNFLFLLVYHSGQAFRPIYYTALASDWFRVAVWGQILNGVTRVAGIVALLYVTYPTRDRFGRAISLCFVILCSYFSYMPRAFPWYYPPATIFGIIAFTRAATSFAFAARDGLFIGPGPQLRKTFIGAAFVILLVGQVVLFWPMMEVQRVSQEEVEDGNRAVIGKWLKENAAPGENVYLEPLGYIGYHSGLHMDDFPGLVSPKVVEIRRHLPRDFQPNGAYRLLVIPELKPDWVVLRLDELQLLMQNSPLYEQFKKDYELRREFNVAEKFNERSVLPAKRFHLYDAYFAVFHRVAKAK